MAPPVVLAPESTGRREAARDGERRTPAIAPPAARGYEPFYGLNEPPFSLTADPRFLYHSAAHDLAAQAMLDAIRRRDGIVVLTGAMGMGKTLLCRTVIDQLDRRTLTSLVADPFVTPEELLKTVLVDFGVISQADRSVGRLADASLADLSAALRDFLYSLAPLQAFAVVIIDEAQNLSIELLDQIRVLAETGGEERLLQVMLVGQPSLSTSLAKPALRPLFHRVSARSVLGPLKADEIPGYVAQRLNVAGPSARVEFDAAASAQLHTLSGGVPRIMNLLCDRALAAGHQLSAQTINADLVREAAADLDLAPRSLKASPAVRRLAMVLVFGLLVLLGAAVGAYVFRGDVAALIDQWQGRPPQPAPPNPALPASPVLPSPRP